MPFAVTHVLTAVIILELWRHYFVNHKETFPLHYLIIGGIASLIPDMDVLVYYAINQFEYSMEEVHRIFSHTLILPLFFVILAVASYGFKSKRLAHRHLKLRNIFLVIAAGIFIHLVLDASLLGFIVPFYPFSDYQFGLNLVSLLPTAWHLSFLPSLDALLLILWLVSLEFRHKLSKFI